MNRSAKRPKALLQLINQQTCGYVINATFTLICGVLLAKIISNQKSNEHPEVGPFLGDCTLAFFHITTLRAPLQYSATAGVVAIKRHLYNYVSRNYGIWNNERAAHDTD